MAGKHETIIAAAAKATLEQLGFKRVGRSRLWVADRLWWLNVVEFTPNRWTKGVNLMSAAHWLWCEYGFKAFNHAIQSRQHAEFETEEQFRTAAVGIAEEAANTAQQFEVEFSTFERVTEFVVSRARNSMDRMGTSWWGLEAGVASGLCGRTGDAEYFLRHATGMHVKEKSAHFLTLMDDPQAFVDEVNKVVARERAIWNLPPFESPPF